MSIPEPTVEQCNLNAKVFEDENNVYYAIWYPQMGGYAAKAVVMMDKNFCVTGELISRDCFDVFIWHDGEFPFCEEDNLKPVQIHHCDPHQFVKFGEKVADLQKNHCHDISKDWPNLKD